MASVLECVHTHRYTDTVTAADIDLCDALCLRDKRTTTLSLSCGHAGNDDCLKTMKPRKSVKSSSRDKLNKKRIP